jgi:prepilin peptidase CpaA
MSFAIRLLACAALLCLAAYDVRARRLPTGLVAIVAALYFIDAAVVRAPLTLVGLHFLVALACFAVTAGMFALNWMGGGDVKLATAVFLWSGSLLGVPVLFVTSMLGLLLALVGLAVHQASRRKLRIARWTPVAMFSSERGVPYGVALAAAGALAVLLPVGMHAPLH